MAYIFYLEEKYNKHWLILALVLISIYFLFIWIEVTLYLFIPIVMSLKLGFPGALCLKVGSHFLVEVFLLNVLQICWRIATLGQEI